MIVLFVILFLLFACSLHRRERFVLMKQRSDVLKALFPFAIIIGHVYFYYPNFIFQDFRWAGPYVVGLFFFMSGYGLEYKYDHGSINFTAFKKRIKDLLVPVIPPLIIYLLVRWWMGEPIRSYIINDLKSYNLILPMTWFVISLIFLYVFYFVGRGLRLNNKVFDGWVFLLTTILAVVLIKAKMSGTTFESNYAFLCGVLFKQCEKKLLTISFWGASVLSLLILAVVALSYVHNEPLFRGFAIIGVLFYVMAFFYVISFIPFGKIPFVLFFKSISYEMYLCQGIFFLFLIKFHLTWYVFVILLLAGDVACAWICQCIVKLVRRKYSCKKLLKS